MFQWREVLPRPGPQMELWRALRCFERFFFLFYWVTYRVLLFSVVFLWLSGSDGSRALPLEDRFFFHSFCTGYFSFIRVFIWFDRTSMNLIQTCRSLCKTGWFYSIFNKVLIDYERIFQQPNFSWLTRLWLGWLLNSFFLNFTATHRVSFFILPQSRAMAPLMTWRI